MLAKEFVFWLDGFLASNGTKSLESDQIRLIEQNLNSVFVHEIDPEAGDQAHQDELNDIHNGGASTGDVLFRC